MAFIASGATLFIARPNFSTSVSRIVNPGLCAIPFRISASALNHGRRIGVYLSKRARYFKTPGDINSMPPSYARVRHVAFEQLLKVRLNIGVASYYRS